MATWVTPWLVSQSDRAKRSRVIVEKVRTSSVTLLGRSAQRRQTTKVAGHRREGAESPNRTVSPRVTLICDRSAFVSELCLSGMAHMIASARSLPVSIYRDSRASPLHCGLLFVDR